MCGIAGEIRFDGQTPSLAALQRALDAQRARGPDDAGVHQHGAVALGHRRLSIIDLSSRGAQPMVDAELGLTLVFNGCIYNHIALRAELEQLGYRFQSRSDSEVILKAWHAWREHAVDRLLGMFAFVVHERDSGRVAMARDRLGIKPLYLCESPGGLRFASSLPALLAAGDVDTRIDPEALHFYLHWHAVVPAPWTILRGVRKLPPATLRIIEPDGRRRDIVFWNPPYGTPEADRAVAFEEWQEQVLAALRLAVERRLVADVPVGVLLSGGVDSSLIVGLLAEAGQHGLATFSVGFETVGGEVGDEFEYSDIIARRFDTRHHRIHVDSRARLLPELPGCVRAMSEPMVSHDAIGFYLLSEEVSKHVKVVQSGQGADEVFGGYHWYPPMLDSNDPVGDYSRAFFDRDAEAYRDTVMDDWHVAGLARHWVAEHFDTPGAATAADKALRLDTHVMLVDDPVKRVDNMTMAFGLEARVPFLDHELVELAARIPPEMKIGHGGKHVLKEAARRVIPGEVIDRPKGYFPVPALKHLEGEVLALVRQVLTDPRARRRGLFRPAHVERLLANPNGSLTPLRGNPLWQLALLELWLQTHDL
jgi:asparagine synthase (glutamine-hydrolysing)